MFRELYVYIFGCLLLMFEFFCCCCCHFCCLSACFQSMKNSGCQKDDYIFQIGLDFMNLKFQLVKMCKGWSYYVLIFTSWHFKFPKLRFLWKRLGSNIFELTPTSFYNENWFNCFDAGIIFKTSRMKDVEELIQSTFLVNL